VRSAIFGNVTGKRLLAFFVAQTVESERHYFPSLISMTSTGTKLPHVMREPVLQSLGL
jgi:hypothetical protein